MKFDFVQKKGVVVALATALSVAAFGVTAFAGIGFKGPTVDQSIYFQSNQSEWGLFEDGTKRTEINLTKNNPSKPLDLSVIARDGQSTYWTLEQTSGTDVVTYTGTMPNYTLTALKDGTAYFELKKGDDVLTIKVTASGWSTGGGSNTPVYTGGGGAPATPNKEETKPEKDDTKPGKDDEAATVPTATVVEKNGKQVAVDEAGKVIKKSIVSINGKDCVTNAKGEVVKAAFAKTKDGAKVYAKKNGAIVKDKVFTVDNKKYVADKTGAIAVKKFVTTKKGKTVYANKNGVVVQNKAFKVNGKQYVANKAGTVVKNDWITIGKTKYYCNKKGVVTKTKAVTKTKK